MLLDTKYVDYELFALSLYKKTKKIEYLFTFSPLQQLFDPIFYYICTDKQ